MPLSQEDITGCRVAFNNFDKDGSGTKFSVGIDLTTSLPAASIDASELKATLNALGQDPSDPEIFQMISQVDDDGSGEIEFAEFLKVIETQKASAAKANDESDTIEAFVALGGNSDKSGEFPTEKLREVVKDFGLTIDIEKLIRETDTDNSKKIDYSEFKAMMS